MFSGRIQPLQKQKDGWTLGIGHGMRPAGQLVRDDTCIRREWCSRDWEAQMWPQSGLSHHQICMPRRPPLLSTWSLA